MRKTVVVTGATGFIGQAVVQEAKKAGWHVVGIGRSNMPAPTDKIAYCAIDLSATDALDKLKPHVSSASAVIHLASVMSGDAKAHDLGTIKPTQCVLSALQGLKTRLVLVSSMAVFGYASLPDGALLDELTPIDIDLDKRDPYASAKITQERMAVSQAVKDSLNLFIVRPGAIYGPGRLSTGRLGLSFKGLILQIGKATHIPAIDVRHVAKALVQAATMERPEDTSAHYGAVKGQITAVNLIDPHPPTAAQWARSVGKKTLVLPHKPLFKVLEFLDLVGSFFPRFYRLVPSSLKYGNFSARFRPLYYSTTKSQDVFDVQSGSSFTNAIRDYQSRDT